MSSAIRAPATSESSASTNSSASAAWAARPAASSRFSRASRMDPSSPAATPVAAMVEATSTKTAANRRKRRVVVGLRIVKGGWAAGYRPRVGR